jgi:hypothetical protein
MSLFIRIARSLNPTFKPKLVKEYGCPSHGQAEVDKARKHNIVYSAFGE